MNERLKELRKSLKLSQADFAEKIDTTGNYIYMMESGKSPVNDKVLNRICKEFNVNEEWLRTGKGKMEKPLSRPEEIARITNELLKDNDPFKTKLVSIVSQMDAEQIAILKKYAVELAKSIEE